MWITKGRRSMCSAFRCDAKTVNAMDRTTLMVFWCQVISSILCGPSIHYDINVKFSTQSKLKSVFRWDAIVNLIYRSIILLTVALLIEYNVVEFDYMKCTSNLIKENFPLFCYILVSLGFLHYLVIEAMFFMISFRKKVEIPSVLPIKYTHEQCNFR